MDSDPVIELLRAASNELHRLEPLLQQNPIYRRVEALRRVMVEYKGIADSRGRDLTFAPDPAMTTSVPEPRPDPTAPATVSPSRPLASPDLTRRASAEDAAADPDGSATIPSSRVPTRRRGGWTRGDSQAARIRDAAAPYLREKGKPATGTEIYRAISAKGVKVRGNKPSAVVCNALRYSLTVFELTPKGFGLREWSNKERAPKGPIGVE